MEQWKWEERMEELKKTNDIPGMIELVLVCIQDVQDKTDQLNHALDLVKNSLDEMKPAGLSKRGKEDTEEGW